MRKRTLASSENKIANSSNLRMEMKVWLSENGYSTVRLPGDFVSAARWWPYSRDHWSNKASVAGLEFNITVPWKLVETHHSPLNKHCTTN